MRKIKTIIKEEIENLNEIFNSPIETKYNIIKKDISGYDGIVYRFNTNSNIW